MVILHASHLLDGVTFHGCSRLERTKKWLKYYKGLQNQLGYEMIVGTDNHSPLEMWEEVGATVTNEAGSLLLAGDPNHIVRRYDTKLVKKEPNKAFGADYLFVWRNLWDISERTKDPAIHKIIRIDTDAYILTKRLADFVRNQNSGWVCVKSRGHNMPEDTIMVLSKDAFPNIQAFCPGEDYSIYHGKYFEDSLPLTGLTAQFVGDRFGEWQTPPSQSPEFDFMCQVRNSMDVVFDRYCGGEK